MEPSKKSKNRKPKLLIDASPPMVPDLQPSSAPSVSLSPETLPSTSQSSSGDLAWLSDVFSSLSLEQIESAYKEAGCDPFKAAGILGTPLALEETKQDERNLKRGSLISESSSQKKSRKARRRPHVAASCGTVSGVVGKGHGGPLSDVNGRNVIQRKEVQLENSIEKSEQFLCSMLGEESDLHLGVVRDILGLCRSNVAKALELLLELSDPLQLADQRSALTCFASERQCNQFPERPKRNEQPMDPQQSKADVQKDILRSLFNVPEVREMHTNAPGPLNWKHIGRKLQNDTDLMLLQPKVTPASWQVLKKDKILKNTVTIDLHGQHIKEGMALLKRHLMVFLFTPAIDYLRVITGCGEGRIGNGKMKHSFKSLVNREGIQCTEENPGSFVLNINGRNSYRFAETEMSTNGYSCKDWRNLIKLLKGNRDLQLHCLATPACGQTLEIVRGDSYTELRAVAQGNWDLMKTYYERAAMGYSRGNRSHASCLAQKGKYYRGLAFDESEKASQDIFYTRNKDKKNIVTIDLRGQHVRQAMDFLKRHLLLFSCLPSIHYLKIITGCDENGVGKEKMKRSVKCLVAGENIDCTEENTGMLMLRIEGRTEYSFAAADSDEE